MAKNDRDLIRYYDLRASEYEQIYYRDVPERQAELAAEGKRLTELVRGREVLDLACGTGYWLERMAASAASIVACDINAAMLSEARKRQLPPIAYVRGDLHRAPFAANSADVVTLGFWFSHHPRQEWPSLFDTVIRLVRPAGQVWMIDNNPPAEGSTREPVGCDEFGNNRTRRYLENGEAHVILKNYFRSDELQELFSPRFRVERLTYGEYYWSVVLSPQ